VTREKALVNATKPKKKVTDGCNRPIVLLVVIFFIISGFFVGSPYNRTPGTQYSKPLRQLGNSAQTSIPYLR
jgi:peptidoglycan/LPS O-acetylase OafA/YrhL